MGLQLWIILVENTIMMVCWAANSRRFRTVASVAETRAVAAAKAWLDHPAGGRPRVARAARSVAKDYLQDQAQARGEPWAEAPMPMPGDRTTS